ncbi:MAG: HAMP domain-containing histidine kinase, partial [Bacteroidota bacterium]|nr:HAMP domain-containing histidine kinase [Bacteroidota bacterium]
KKNEKFVIAFISNISIRKGSELEIKKLNDELEHTVEQRTEELTNAMHQLEESKEELSKALDTEKELGELKSRFVSMASHQFRTPLSTVLSSSYLIQKYVTAEEQGKREKHLERIVSSVNMLTSILNDFLSLGKIEEGKIQVRLSEFNIEESVRSITNEIRDSLKEGQTIRYRHNGNQMVYLDSVLFKHILLNLISNASKFSDENKTIEITTEVRDMVLSLFVRDYGLGISKDDQKHLMERFFRGSNVANIQGTGLGLHIISKYAELMNGNVECKSELDKGTEFIIRFDFKEQLS